MGVKYAQGNYKGKKIHFILVLVQSLRFKNFGLKPSFCYENKTDFGWFVLRIRITVGSYSHRNLEYANPNQENPPTTTFNRFYELNSVENKMQLKSERPSRK